jgi:protease I
MPRALVIIAEKGFQDHEFEGTKRGLVDKGFDVTVASTRAGPCTGKFGATVEATIALGDVRVDAFDRVAFIGGPGAHALMDNVEAHRIARDTVNAGKVLGAICIAPTILARAGVLAGKKATVWNGDGATDQILRDGGAAYTGSAVTVDGAIVTGNGPEAAEEFGKTLAAM